MHRFNRFIFSVLVRIVLWLRPIVRIRFGYIQADRIGKLAAYPDVYLSRKLAEPQNDTARTVDVFCYWDAVCNEQLLKMWSRKIRLSNKWGPRFLSAIDEEGAADRHTFRVDTDRDPQAYTNQSGPFLSFTPEEEERGRRELERMGIAGPFVCFHSRDSAYLKTVDADFDWSYHNFRDSRIENCLPAIEALVEAGYTGVRMGSVVAEKLQSDNPKIIDYANLYRSDFLDMYLSAKCEFFICNTAGVYALPVLFRRPILQINAIPIQAMFSWNKRYLGLPKRFVDAQSGAALGYREVIERGIHVGSVGEEFAQAGVRPIESTAEEIKAAALEMRDRQQGQWSESPDEAALQKKFWDLIEKDGQFNGVVHAKVAYSFLKANEALLN